MQQIFGPPGAQLHNQPARSSATAKRHGPVIIVGTDIPEVCPGHIAAAFRALGNHDMVFGPATDGGFWLVGMRRTPRIRDAFRNIRWSTSETLEDCLLGMTGSRVATVATLRDVDDLSDMRALGGAIGRFLLPASSAATTEATRAAQFRAVDTG
jgi:glycosyltransferase A (GT-A) superfamily protein (DUF2064 family)